MLSFLLDYSVETVSKYLNQVCSSYQLAAAQQLAG